MAKPWAFALAACLAWTGAAAAAETGPAVKLEKTIDRVIGVLYGPEASETTVAEKRERVREVARENFSFDVMIRRAVGRNWRALTEPQQRKVVDLVTDLIVATYIESFEEDGRPEVSLGETVEITDKRIEIPSEVKFQGRNIDVLYRLGKMRSGWQVYDVIVEGVSMVSNYRQQFSDHFRSGDAEGLIERLRTLLEKKRNS